MSASSPEIIQCIALRSVRYGDNSLMVTALTRSRGRVSIAINSLSSREGRRQRILMSPGGVFECRVSPRPAEVLRVSDVRLLEPLPQMHVDTVKMLVGGFCCDVVAAVANATDADPLLFDFVVDAFRALDGMPPAGVANFPSLFLMKLSRYVGIEPDTRGWRPGMVFDMMAATYSTTPPASHHEYLTDHEARMVSILARMPWRAAPLLRLTREQRTRMLDLMLRYFDLHYRRLSSLPSLVVLRSLFD